MKIKGALQQLVKEAAVKAFGKLPEFEIVEPPQKEFGDFSTALPLQLTKTVKKDPAVLAQRIKSELAKMKRPFFLNEITVTRPGYLNFIIDYFALAKQLFAQPLPLPKRMVRAKTLIEHTSINPNKAAHIGHLRNALLGDTLARLLTSAGERVEVQNYIDNTGLQVADSLLAFKVLAKGRKPRGIELDHLLWDLYPRLQQEYEREPKLLTERKRILEQLEKGGNKEAKEALKLTRQIVKRHLAGLAKMNVRYDLLVWESDILKSHLWETLFAVLKQKRIVSKEKVGPNRGAWVVKFGSQLREDKILVKSDGLATYTAKDLAYALWKFGRTKTQFTYSLWGKQKDGSPLWTTSAGSDRPRRTPQKQFGRAQKVITVIDSRQSYPQQVIKDVLKRLGFKEEAAHLIHLAYGVVYLSPATMKSLGYRGSRQSRNTMSGREGIGVKVDDLFESVARVIAKKNPRLPKEALEALAAAALRYYLLRFRPEREINFDLELATEVAGNSGVYLQYAHARASNILKKAGKQTSRLRFPVALNEDEKNLLKELSFCEEVIEKAASGLNPSLLTDYLWRLSCIFTNFYESSPVLQAEGASLVFRLRLVELFKKLLAQALTILGITPLERI